MAAHALFLPMDQRPAVRCRPLIEMGRRGGMTDDELAALFAIPKATLKRAFCRNSGWSVWEADDRAIALGYHPVEVWGDEWHVACSRLPEEDDGWT